MASNESILEQANSDLVNKTIKIQSYVRRWLVKKMVTEIQQLYKDIVIDLEGQETEVVWPRNILSYSSVRKTSPSVVKKSSSANLHNSCQHKLTIPPPCIHCLSTSEVQIKHAFGDVIPEKHNLISTQVQTDLDVDKEQIPSSLPFLEEGEKENVEYIAAITNKSERNVEINLLHDQHAVVQTETKSDQSSIEKFVVNKESVEISDKIIKINDLSAQKALVLDEREKQKQSEQKLQAQNKVLLMDTDLPDDKDQLLQLKSTTAMELLWVQQAINSRKQYLRLKQGIQ